MQPIYEQILGQIKENILSGGLGEHAPLPSIRALAKELKISVITTKRAYDELEAQGYIYTVAGKGCFVAPMSRSKMDAELEEKLRRTLKEVYRLAKMGGLGRAEIIDMLDAYDWEF